MPRSRQHFYSPSLKRESSSFPLPHHPPEIMEKVMRIMRSWRRFRVVLHAEQRQRLVAQAFQRLVVQVYVGQFHFAQVDRVRIDGEVMIVGRDLHLAGRVVLYRMISAVVPEFQLVGAPAQREASELVAQED